MKANTLRNKLNGLQLLLGSVPFKISLEKNLLNRWENLGQISYYENRIALENDLHERDMLQALIHEIIEFVNRDYTLHFTHEYVVILEVALMDILMKNPQLCKIISEEAERNIWSNVAEEETEVTTA